MPNVAGYTRGVGRSFTCLWCVPPTNQREDLLARDREGDLLPIERIFENLILGKGDEENMVASLRAPEEKVYKSPAKKCELTVYKP